MSSVTGHAHGRLPCSAAKSAPEKAATTPGMPRAPLRSTPVIFACANGLRTNAMCSMPGSLMLSVQLVCPVMSLASSFRSLALPSSAHGADDVLVSGAAAEIALKPLPDLLVSGVRVVLEQVGGRHDHAGCAVAALHRVLGVERALHGAERAIGQALDGGDIR